MPVMFRIPYPVASVTAANDTTPPRVGSACTAPQMLEGPDVAT